MLRPNTTSARPECAVFQVEKEMADVVGQAEEKERRLIKSRKKLERKLVGCSALSGALPFSTHSFVPPCRPDCHRSADKKQTIELSVCPLLSSSANDHVQVSREGPRSKFYSPSVCRPAEKVEARGEIEDLTTEHETEREELLDSIRNQNKELQLWEQVRRSVAGLMCTSESLAAAAAAAANAVSFAVKQPGLALVEMLYSSRSRTFSFWCACRSPTSLPHVTGKHAFK